MLSVRGSELPERWKKCITLNPDRFCKVTIEPLNDEDREESMPDEEEFRPDFVQAVKEGEPEYIQGRGSFCRNKKETDTLFDTIWNSPDE